VNLSVGVYYTHGFLFTVPGVSFTVYFLPGVWFGLEFYNKQETIKKVVVSFLSVLYSSLVTSVVCFF
jgi:hypothetical protein